MTKWKWLRDAGGMHRLFRRSLIVLSVVSIGLAAGCVSNSGSSSNAAQGEKRSEVHTQLAWNYLQRGHYDIAREELDKALAADGSSSRAHHIYGLLFNSLGETQPARKHFSRAVQIDPNNLGAQEDYAGFLCKNGDVTAGLARYREVIANPRNSQLAMTRTRAGLCLLGDGQADEAEQYFRQALDSNPSNQAALAAMARISFETGRYLSGRGYVQRYMVIGPNNPQVLFYAASIERKLGDDVSARAYASELRRLFPESREAQELGDS